MTRPITPLTRACPRIPGSKMSFSRIAAPAEDSPIILMSIIDRFYNEAGAILIRQLSDAATDVGSYWLTAWVNAGRPQLPPQ